MLTKDKDVRYCNVNEDKIKSSSPTFRDGLFERFMDFVIERYSVYKKKDVEKLPKPWTTNPILLQYKFTNVRREHDRQTKYLIENITNSVNLTLEDKIVNSILFRAWNLWDTLKDFGFPYKASEIYSSELKERVRPVYEKLKAERPGRLWFTNAFNCGSIKSSWKYPDGKPHKSSENLQYEKEIPLRPFHLGQKIYSENLVNKILNSPNQYDCFKIIQVMKGYSTFLAYQVFVDLTYIPEFPFSENEFTMAGPGCRRGLDCLFESHDGLSYEELLFWLRDNIQNEAVKHHIPYEPDRLFSDLPKHDRYLNLMSLENCFCEFSKYCKMYEGVRSRRRRYNGTGN